MVGLYRCLRLQLTALVPQRTDPGERPSLAIRAAVLGILAPVLLLAFDLAQSSTSRRPRRAPALRNHRNGSPYVFTSEHRDHVQNHVLVIARRHEQEKAIELRTRYLLHSSGARDNDGISEQHAAPGLQQGPLQMTRGLSADFVVDRSMHVIASKLSSDCGSGSCASAC